MPRFAFEYADKRREQLEQLGSVAQIADYLTTQGTSLLFEYAYYAQAEGVPIRTTLLHRSSDLILRQLKAMIADNVSPDRNAFYWIFMQQNPELTLSQELIRTGRWLPTLPTQHARQTKP